MSIPLDLCFSLLDRKSPFSSEYFAMPYYYLDMKSLDI